MIALKAAAGTLLALCALLPAAGAVRRENGALVYLHGGRPFFVYSAAFPYLDYPKDLWPEALARLKNVGFNTLQLAAPPSPAADTPQSAAGWALLTDALRLCRQLGLRVWFDGDVSAAALQPFLSSRGGPVLEDLSAIHAAWSPRDDNPAAGRRFHPGDLASLRQVIEKQAAQKKVPAILSSFDAGSPLRPDAAFDPPNDPSNHLLATRELLAAGAKGFNESSVLEGWSEPARECAFAINGEPRARAAVLERNGSLLAGFGRMLAALAPVEPSGADQSSRAAIVPAAQQKPFPLVRLALLGSRAPNGPAFLSALNYSETRLFSGAVSVADPRSGRQLVLRHLNLPARQALLLPINLALNKPDLCPTCAPFGLEERIVSATAELLSVARENGVLSFEFVAPAEGELVLELMREPRGPLLTAGRPGGIEWNERTHTLRARIPAGKAPDFHSRLAIAVEAPDTSVFLKAPPRLIPGSRAVIRASFSSKELTERSRLLAPAGWKVTTASKPLDDVEYAVEVPADAIAGDKIPLALEMEGRVAETVTALVAPAFSLRVQPEDVLHLRPQAELAIRPYYAALPLPGRREYHLYLKNNADEIRTFRLSASGGGIDFAPATQEITIGPGLEREATLTASPAEPHSGLRRWTLEIQEGATKSQLPFALLAVAKGEALAYDFDLDRDGFSELILENQRLRAVFSPRHQGHAVEFLLKDAGVNALLRPGIWDAAGGPVEGKVLGPGRIELRSAAMTRRISLGGQDAFFEVEQNGGSGEWTFSTPVFNDQMRARFRVEAPGGSVTAQQSAGSVRYRLRFEDGVTRRAKFYLEPVTPPAKPEPKPASE